VLLACVICGLAGFALFRPFSSTAMPAPTEPSALTEPPLATDAPAPTEPPLPTDVPLYTATRPPAAVPSPTARSLPTATPAPFPVPPTVAQPQTLSVRINRITINSQRQYVVEYETFGYTEKLPGVHVHFFFNTVPPQQAGVPGSGPWILYGGPRPFTGYRVTDRPPSATQMCSLVANPDHSIHLNSGNCVALP
jgi:hypothetical protein